MITIKSLLLSIILVLGQWLRAFEVIRLLGLCKHCIHQYAVWAGAVSREQRTTLIIEPLPFFAVSLTMQMPPSNYVAGLTGINCMGATSAIFDFAFRSVALLGCYPFAH